MKEIQFKMDHIKNNYRISLAFWKMGEKFLNFVYGSSELISSNENKSIIISNSPINDDEFEEKTRWNDTNMAIPLLFNFYHGLELILKGFFLLHNEKENKLTHSLSELYDDFEKNYKSQEKLLNLFGKYLMESKMPEILYSFLNCNKLDVDRFYESLRYPYNRKLSVKYDHFDLKDQDYDGIEFYKSLCRDIEEIIELTVNFAKNIEFFKNE